MAEQILGGLSRFTIAGISPTAPIGAAIGQYSAVPAGDTTANAFSVTMANAANITASEIVTENFLGGDKVKATMSFGRANITQAEITIDAEDLEMIAFFGGLTVNTTYNSLMPHSTIEVDALKAVQCCAILSQRRSNLVTGVAGYRHYVIPNCLAVPIPTSFSYQAKRTLSLRLIANVSTKLIGGDDVADLSLGVADDELFSYYIDMPHQLGLCTYVADGIETTFTPQYLPATSGITANATYNHFLVDGTVTALTSFSTTTGLATMAAAGSSGDVNVLIYGTDYVPV